MTDPMTAAPSGWLTEEGLVRVGTSIAECRKGGTVWLFARDADALVEMARAALSHQAALETATRENCGMATPERHRCAVCGATSPRQRVCPECFDGSREFEL